LAAAHRMETVKAKSQLERLRKLEEECQRLRNSLDVSKRGEVIFQAPNSMWSDNDIVVEADGIGGAKLKSGLTTMWSRGRIPCGAFSLHRS